MAVVDMHLADGRPGVAIDEAGLALIARSAEGSMRDAQSALDQVIAFAGESVSVDEAATTTGMETPTPGGRTLVESVAAEATEAEAASVESPWDGGASEEAVSWRRSSAASASAASSSWRMGEPGVPGARASDGAKRAPVRETPKRAEVPTLALGVASGAEGESEGGAKAGPKAS